MHEFNTYVLANKIWENANPEIDLGQKDGFVRGYCIEVYDGKNCNWLSCTYINCSPEAYFNSKFYEWYYKEHDCVPTGRICFRGYAVERWNDEVGDYVEPVHFIDETYKFLYELLSDSEKEKVAHQETLLLENDDFVHYNIKSLLTAYILRLMEDRNE